MPDSQLEGFALCGDDHKWVWAQAQIVGNEVVVSLGFGAKARRRSLRLGGKSDLQPLQWRRAAGVSFPDGHFPGDFG